jgi:hypothetical protein
VLTCGNRHVQTQQVVSLNVGGLGGGGGSACHASHSEVLAVFLVVVVVVVMAVVVVVVVAMCTYVSTTCGHATAQQHPALATC